MITSEDGTRIGEFQNYPFGEPLLDSTLGVIGYKYTGQELDEEIGLYYYGARYYDPRLSRFINIDLLRDNLNLYMYCRNNPLRYIDTTGYYDEEVHFKKTIEWATKAGLDKQTAKVLAYVSIGYDEEFEVMLKELYKKHGENLSKYYFDPALKNIQKQLPTHYATKEEAEKIAKKLIDEAILLWKKGLEDTAINRMARATHTIQDSIAHEGINIREEIINILEDPDYPKKHREKYDRFGGKPSSVQEITQKQTKQTIKSFLDGIRGKGKGKGPYLIIGIGIVLSSSGESDAAENYKEGYEVSEPRTTSNEEPQKYGPWPPPLNRIYQ